MQPLVGKAMNGIDRNLAYPLQLNNGWAISYMRTVQVERRPTAGYRSLIIRKIEDAKFSYQSHAAYPKAKF